MRRLAAVTAVVIVLLLVAGLAAAATGVDETPTVPLNAVPAQKNADAPPAEARQPKPERLRPAPAPRQDTPRPESRPARPPRPRPAEAPARQERPGEWLAMACRDAREAEQWLVRCKWSPSQHPQFAAYELWRAERGADRRVIFRTDDRNQTTATDTDVAPGTGYAYAVVALDHAGNRVAMGGPVKVMVAEPDKPRPEPMRLACEAAGGADPSVTCRWSPSDAADFAGYRLWRASEGKQRAVIFSTGDRAASGHVDNDVEPGRHVYWVEAVDADGATIAHSRPAPVEVPPAVGPAAIPEKR